MKILLIYPAPFRVTGLPLSIASLSAVLKQNGNQVKVFDTAFYRLDGETSQTQVRSQRMVSKQVSDEDTYLPMNSSGMEEDLTALIREYEPDLVGLSVLEIMYSTALRITRLIKKEFSGMPVIMGGVFPTFCPQLVIEEDSVDMICRGEGETPMVQLCERMSSGSDYSDVEGLWVKKDGRVYKNGICKLHDMNILPFPDFSEFDKRLFYKPMQGRMYKMANVETSRGCVFACTYCGAPRLRDFFRENGSGIYFRNMDISRVIDQINFQIRKHDPEFIYFSSESFLTMNERHFNAFIKAYDKIRIPFWIQTRVETISKEHLFALREVGLHWMSIGLEHGNEEFRRKMLKRNYSNEIFLERMDILRQLDMGASVNNIIGFPFETRELVFDTIRMNRMLWQNNPKLEINVFVFTPYKGSQLYDVCRDNGMLYNDDVISTSTLDGKSPIRLPEDFNRDVRGLVRTFNMYVRLPEKYFDDIRTAEQDNEKGNTMLERLKGIAA